MRVRDVQVEKEKIDYVPKEKTIGEISQDAGQQQRERYVAPNVSRTPSHEKDHNNEKRDRRNYDEKRIVVPERTKRCTGVRDVYQTKETGDQDPRLIRVDKPQDQLFRPLIERIERQRKEEDVSHTDVVTSNKQDG